MPDPREIPDVIEGQYGTAELVPMPDIPQAAMTVCNWLITAPIWHPLWSQYLVACVRLIEAEGWPPPYRQFEGATHEIMCYTIDPTPGFYTIESIQKHARTGDLPRLEPVNVAVQIAGTDAEAEQLTRLAAWGLCNGMLEPESSNGAERIGAVWKHTIAKSLEHVRGGHRG